MKRIVLAALLATAAMTSTANAFDFDTAFEKGLSEKCWSTIAVAHHIAEQESNPSQEGLQHMERDMEFFLNTHPGTYTQEQKQADVNRAIEQHNIDYDNFVGQLETCAEMAQEQPKAKQPAAPAVSTRDLEVLGICAAYYRVAINQYERAGLGDSIIDRAAQKYQQLMDLGAGPYEAENMHSMMRLWAESFSSVQAKRDVLNQGEDCSAIIEDVSK